MRLSCSVVIAFALSACATSKRTLATPDGSADVASADTAPHSSELAGSTHIDAANAVALSWLALVDQGKYGESWDAAAPIFRQAVDRDHWATQVGSGRAPLGKLALRKLLSAQYTTSLPGVGDGQYVIIHYAAAYENKPRAIETVTPMLTPAGTWQVAGYYIK